MSNFVINPYIVKEPVVTTWNQLNNDYSFVVASNDWYAIGLEIQSDSTIITDPVTNVQWNYLTYSSPNADGSISCCRWEDLTAFTASSASALLSQANHTYWTMDLTDVTSGMTDNTVTSSTKLADGNIVGYVVHGGTGTYSVTGRFQENTLYDTDPKRASALQTASYSSAPAFTISTTS
jgi:hypothetical protein